MDHNLQNIHGSCVIDEVLKLIASGTAQTEDTVLLPSRYRIKIADQPVSETIVALKEIQSYTNCKDFRAPKTNTCPKCGANIL